MGFNYSTALSLVCSRSTAKESPVNAASQRASESFLSDSERSGVSETESSKVTAQLELEECCAPLRVCSESSPDEES